MIDLEGTGRIMRGDDVLEVGGAIGPVKLVGTFLGRSGSWASGNDVVLELDSGNHVAIQIDDVTVTRRGLLYRILVTEDIPDIQTHITKYLPT
jgi:hypothetical protein